MARLKVIENLVLGVLEESPAARGDDYVLMWLVCQKVKPELCEKPFGDVLYHHKSLGLPNWESVTRCRRKIQAKRPDLTSDVTTRRKREEVKYKKYARAK